MIFAFFEIVYSSLAENLLFGDIQALVILTGRFFSCDCCNIVLFSGEKETNHTDLFWDVCRAMSKYFIPVCFWQVWTGLIKCTYPVKVDSSEDMTRTFNLLNNWINK